MCLQNPGSRLPVVPHAAGCKTEARGLVLMDERSGANNEMQNGEDLYAGANNGHVSRVIHTVVQKRNAKVKEEMGC